MIKKETIPFMLKDDAMLKGVLLWFKNTTLNKLTHILLNP
jgi:hypothetical protein